MLVHLTFSSIEYKSDLIWYGDDKKRYGKFYPKKVIRKKLSTNKWRKKFYPEVLSKNFFIQKVRDLFYFTLSY